MLIFLLSNLFHIDLSNISANVNRLSDTWHFIFRVFTIQIGLDDDFDVYLKFITEK